MKKGRLKRGFTIIEVVLFLAISGAIFAMVMANTTTSLARRRYDDTVHDVVEEIRNAYSATANVENYRMNTEDSSYFCSVTSAFLTGTLKINSPVDTSINKKSDNYPGRTKCAIYGQIITFGEDNSTDIHRYDLIGLAVNNDIDPQGSDETLAALKKVGANIITMVQQPLTAPNPTNCKASLAGTTSVYTPQWTGTIENKEDRNLYRGAIMIARSPVSSTVHTYFYSATGDIASDNPINDTTFYVNKWVKNTNTPNCAGYKAYQNRFAAIDSWHWRNDKDLDICIGSEDLYAVGDHRRAVRIHKDGSNESSVELLPETESALVCKVKTP